MPYIALTIFYGFTLTNGMPVFASGCKNHFNKITTIECSEEKTECNSYKDKKYQIEKTTES